jgi:transaldolase
MFDQGREMFSWIPNAYIKYPCTAEGLRAAQMSVRQGMRVNITLCFSQQQGAAVYTATKGTKQPAYVSPFVGRLDDIGQNGMDVVRNIKQMFRKGDGHVLTNSFSTKLPASRSRTKIDLERPWETFDIQHELTRKGIEKFAADYRATLSRPA